MSAKLCWVTNVDYLREAYSRLSSERHSINASYPSPCCTLTQSRGPGGKGAGDSLLPEGMT